MSIVAVTSMGSSPGASSLAVGLTMSYVQSGRAAMLLEADPAGGSLAPRFGLPAGYDSIALVTATRHGFDPTQLFSHTVSLGGAHCLPTPVDPAASARAISECARQVAPQLHAFDMQVVIDMGRLTLKSPSLDFAPYVDRVLLVLRPRLEEVQLALYGIRLLSSVGLQANLVVIGSDPYRPMEVAAALGAPLVAILPDDPATAVALSGGRFSPWRLSRSILMRSIDSLVERLLWSADQTGIHHQAQRDDPVDQPVPTAEIVS